MFWERMQYFCETAQFFGGKTVVMRGNSLSGKRNIFESKYFVGKHSFSVKQYFGQNAKFIMRMQYLCEHAKIFWENKNIASK